MLFLLKQLMLATDPVRVELLDPKPPPGWIESLSHFAWPATIFLLLIVYRDTLSGFLAVISQRASEINIGSWASFKLPILTETPLDQEVSDFRQIEGNVVTESYKTELFKQFRSSRKDEYAVINLGEGREWISSRLYIFALMLQRMKSLKFIVFLQTGGPTSVYVGAANIDRARWGLASRQPWLEAAFARAYAESSPDLQSVTPFTWITSDTGALQADEAEKIVRRYIQLLLPQADVPPAPSADWVRVGGTVEHAKWVAAAEVEQLLGVHLWRDTVHKQEDKKELVKAIVRCSSPYVAITAETGEFLSLVNREELLDKIGRKLS